MFDIKFEHGVVRVAFTDPISGDISDFEAVSNGKGTVTFCDSNGDVRIVANGKTVSFDVSKYGEGGDGEISVSLPFEMCRKALAESLHFRMLMGEEDEEDEEEN